MIHGSAVRVKSSVIKRAGDNHDHGQKPYTYHSRDTCRNHRTNLQVGRAMVSTIDNCKVRQSSSIHVYQTQMGYEQRIRVVGGYLHTIWWRRVNLQTSCFAYSGNLFDYSDLTMPIHCFVEQQTTSAYVCQSQITQ